jgi:hypothetical protein
MHEIERFFTAYDATKGKRFVIVASRGPRAAEKILRDAMN